MPDLAQRAMVWSLTRWQTQTIMVAAGGREDESLQMIIDRIQ
jgi:hypothetical protein